MSYKLLFGLNAQPEIQILNTPYVHKYQKMYVIVCIQKNLLCRQESRVVCPLDLLYTGRTKNIWRSVACNQGAVVWQKNSTIESRLLTGLAPVRVEE